MKIDLVLKDGAVEAISFPNTTAAIVGNSTALVPSSAAGGAIASVAAVTNVNRVSFADLLRELVSATHAFSAEESPKSTPVLVSAPTPEVASALPPLSLGSGAADPTKKASSPAPAADTKSNAVPAVALGAPAPVAAASVSGSGSGGNNSSKPVNSTRSVADCFHITYNDDEGDLVTVSNDAGLTEAYRLADATHKELELSVTVLDTPPPLNSISFASPNFAVVTSLPLNPPPPSVVAALHAPVSPVIAGKPAPLPASVRASGGATATPVITAPPAASAAPPKVTPVIAAPHHQPQPVQSDVKSKSAPAPEPVKVFDGALPEQKLAPILNAITQGISGGSASASPSDSSAECASAESKASPFEAIYMKHARRNLQAFESFYLNLTKDKYVKLTALKQKFARVNPDPQITRNYELLKTRHQQAVATVNTRFQKSVEMLVGSYDQYLSNQPSATFLLPIYVLISVENRGIRVECPVRSIDTVADLREALMEATTKRSPGSQVVPDPVIEFGPFTQFGLKRPDQKSAGAGPSGGSHHHNQHGSGEITSPFSFLDSLFGVSRRASIPKSSEPVYQLLNDESLTMAELNITSGCEFMLIGGVRRKSEKAQCIGGLFAGSNPQAISYYNCNDCGTTAMCYGCASHCHSGHTIVYTPKADQPVLKPNMNGHTLCVCSCTASGVCPIRDPLPVPAALPYYTHELNLLRAMGFSDAAVAHLTMPAPLPLAIPAPVPQANAAPVKAQPQMANPAPTPAVAGAASAPTPTPAKLEAKASGDAKSDAKAAPAPVDAKHSPVLAPTTPAPALPPIQPPAPVAVAVATAPLITVSLRALLQSKGGNVQAVVDTLLLWEKQGLLKSPKSASGGAPAPQPAASAAR